MRACFVVCVSSVWVIVGVMAVSGDVKCTKKRCVCVCVHAHARARQEGLSVPLQVVCVRARARAQRANRAAAT